MKASVLNKWICGFRAFAAVSAGMLISSNVNAQSITMPASLDSVTSGARAGFVALSTTGVTPSVSCPSCAGTDVLRVTIRTSSSGKALVRIGTITGLSQVTGYPQANWTSGSATEIGFEGTLANLNAALSTLAYSGGQGSISASLSPSNVAYYSATGNYYKYITTPLSWQAARLDAISPAKRLFGSVTGYLTTITSAGEFDFVVSKMGIPGGAQIWLGGTRCASPYTVPGCAAAVPNSNSGNSWVWVDGPESGEVFFVGANGGTTPDGKYTSWNPGEPNNSGGEGYLQVTSSGLWNDLTGVGPLDYVIEYTGAGLATNASTSVTGPVLVPVLSPAALLLFASLLAGIGVYFQRRRRINA